jgi:anti-sigma B factor antagonist
MHVHTRLRTIEEAAVTQPVTVSAVPPYTVVTATGELDLVIAPELRRRLQEVLDGGVTEVVVDFSGATFVDSTILGVLVGAQQRLDRVAHPLTVVCAREGVLKVLRLTALDRVFRVRSTLADATKPARL